MYVCMCVYIHIYMKKKYIYIYIYIYIHACTKRAAALAKNLQRGACGAGDVWFICFICFINII